MSNTSVPVSYFGMEGSYSGQAASALYPDATLSSITAFRGVLESVEQGNSVYGVVPVENSIAGRVAEVHQLLMTTSLIIVREHILPIKHNLIGKHSDSADFEIPYPDIETVYSHPQALAQCSEFIARVMPNAATVAATDTAAAVKHVCQSDNPRELAIGSAFAAQIFSGRILEENIANSKENYTRFFSMCKERDVPSVPSGNISSLIFQTEHTPGALILALEVFRNHKINVTKLETYMVTTAVRLPTFFIDVGAGISDGRLAGALSDLESLVPYMKFLGSYAASEDRSTSTGFLPIS